MEFEANGSRRLRELAGTGAICLKGSIETTGISQVFLVMSFEKCFLKKNASCVECFVGPFQAGRCDFEKVRYHLLRDII